MIDHLGLQVSQLAASKLFYQQALAPLGYSLLMELSKEQTGGFSGAGFGIAPKPDFWIGQGTPNRPPIHVAFRAQDRAAVDAFYAAALAAGGKDNGKPGLRPHYHANYYGAFVLDPDGHNIEAVFHG
ncbi:MAG: VOC family protein [Vulcanimicrobiota bacterium]